MLVQHSACHVNAMGCCAHHEQLQLKETRGAPNWFSLMLFVHWLLPGLLRWYLCKCSFWHPPVGFEPHFVVCVMGVTGGPTGVFALSVWSGHFPTPCSERPKQTACSHVCVRWYDRFQQLISTALSAFRGEGPDYMKLVSANIGSLNTKSSVEIMGKLTSFASKKRGWEKRTFVLRPNPLRPLGGALFSVSFCQGFGTKTVLPKRLVGAQPSLVPVLPSNPSSPRMMYSVVRRFVLFETSGGCLVPGHAHGERFDLFSVCYH